MNPTVSLMVPVFNRADLLIPCLDSALAQTDPDFEVVIVDGASTDGTWDVCLRYAAADPRIRIFRDPINTGPVRGWWRCVEEARGIYATFLWSDDLLYPEFLARTVPIMADDDIAFVFTAAEIGPMPGLGKVYFAQSSKVLAAKDFIYGSLSGKGEFPVSPACALFRLADIRQSFLMELPTDPRTDLTATGAGTDLLLYLLTAVRYPRVAHLPEPLAFFRAHEGSITVRGHGGQVSLGYALAKGWFAGAHGHQALSRVILGRDWVRQMRDSRCLLDPVTAAKRYRYMVSPAGLMVGATAELLRRAKRRLNRV